MSFYAKYTEPLVTENYNKADYHAGKHWCLTTKPTTRTRDLLLMVHNTRGQKITTMPSGNIFSKMYQE